MIERAHPDVGEQLLEALRHNPLVLALLGWLDKLGGPEPEPGADIAWEDGEPPEDRSGEPPH